MKERARNVAVGLTVIGALILIGAMIVIFAGVPQIFQRGYEIRILLDSTHDAHEGDPVHLRGMRVGRVTRVRFTDDDPRRGITLTARINAGVNLPGNTRGHIYTKGFAGGAYIELKPEGELRIDERTGQPIEYFPKDGSMVIEGRHFGTELIPGDLKEDLQNALKDFGDLKRTATSALKDFGRLARNLDELLGPPAEAPPTETQPTAPEPKVPKKGLRATLKKLDDALEAVVAVLGSPENQANIKESLSNLAEATAKASDAMDALKAFATEADKAVKDVAKPAAEAGRRFQELAAKLIDSAEKMSAVLVTINNVAAKIEAGEGTAGHLINDPKLYNNLVNTTQHLTELIKELREFVRTWKTSGVPIKLK